MAKKSKTDKQELLDNLAEDERPKELQDQSMGEFINELHGDNTLSQPVDGMPSVEWLQEQFKTKSATIRYLVHQGHPVKSISRHLGIRYQHVRNVSKSELKRGPNEDWRKPYLEGSQISDSKDFKPPEK